MKVYFESQDCIFPFSAISFVRKGTITLNGVEHLATKVYFTGLIDALNLRDKESVLFNNSYKAYLESFTSDLSLNDSEEVSGWGG